MLPLLQWTQRVVSFRDCVLVLWSGPHAIPRITPRAPSFLSRDPAGGSDPRGLQLALCTVD